MLRNLLIPIAAALPSLVFAEPRFAPVEVAEHVYSGGWEHFVGGGLAAFDCDGDNLPELFAAGGEAPASLLRNVSVRGGTVSFVRDTPPSLQLVGVIGAYPLDVDSDGVLDLAVLRVGQNELLRGGADCSFVRFETLGFQSPDRWSTAFSATWETGQALPTLAFGNYVDRTRADGPFEACDVNSLYRPTGPVYRRAQSLSPGYCALSMLYSDWNRQGQRDLRVSNDRHYYVRNGQEQLWDMSGPPRLYTEKDGWQSFSLWGMGIASRDISGDGLPELFLSSMGDQRLQERVPEQSGPSYRDVPFSVGATAHRPFTGGDGRPSTGWHISFGDVQNDGLDDVFIAKGNVEQMPDSAMKDPNNLLVQNRDGTFAEFGDVAGVASVGRSRGAVLMDFNLDGLLDLAVVNRRAPLEVYRNISSDTGNWLSVRLAQPAPNVDAVGAWIEVDDGTRIQAREITVGGGHAGGRAGPEHFGLGRAGHVRLRVIWPDGPVSDWVGVSAGQMLKASRSGRDVTVSAY